MINLWYPCHIILDVYSNVHFIKFFFFGRWSFISDLCSKFNVNSIGINIFDAWHESITGKMFKILIWESFMFFIYYFFSFFYFILLKFPFSIIQKTQNYIHTSSSSLKYFRKIWMKNERVTTCYGWTGSGCVYL